MVFLLPYMAWYIHEQKARPYRLVSCFTKKRTVDFIEYFVSIAWFSRRKSLKIYPVVHRILFLIVLVSPLFRNSMLETIFGKERILKGMLYREMSFNGLEFTRRDLYFVVI